jgi:hypothetical protein
MKFDKQSTATLVSFLPVLVMIHSCEAFAVASIAIRPGRGVRTSTGSTMNTCTQLKNSSQTPRGNDWNKVSRESPTPNGNDWNKVSRESPTPNGSDWDKVSRESPTPNGSDWNSVSPDNYFYDVSSMNTPDETSFYEPEVVSKKTEHKTDPSSAKTAGADFIFPDHFILTDHWNYLLPKQKICDTVDIPAQVAFQVVNKRGAIAHGRDTELNFDVLTMDANPFKTVKEVFDDLGGSKELKDITEIKRELMTRGPVISTSFLLTQPFMAPRENANRFDPNLIGQKYPVVIIGWEHTAFGEVWIIQPLIKNDYNDVQKIAFRQFGIDETIIAPTNTFENTPWQVGPYFDIDMSETPFPDWVTSWPGVETAISSEELEKLGEMLGSDFITASRQRTRFVIRDSKKIARSRACFLTKLEWQPGDKPWRMEVAYQ